MGKKKSLHPKKPVGVRLTPGVFKQLERYAAQRTGLSISAAAAKFIEAALSDNEPGEEQLTLLLTHFEERTAEQINTLNYNLRQATGMILMPKPEHKTKPKEKYRIDSPKEAANWVESKFKEIPG